MFFKRIAKHVVNQNWFAVLVDMFVVIAGIFLGLQAADWNEGRKERSIEKEYLTRITSDFEYNLARSNSLSELHGNLSKELNQVATYLLADEVSEDDTKRINELSFRYFLYPTPDIRFGTYEELISTGRLNLISSSQVKDKIQQVIGEYKRTSGQLDYFRQILLESRGVLKGHGSFQLNDKGQADFKKDFYKVRGDSEFISGVVEEASRHFLMGRYHNEEAKIVSEALAAIKCYQNEKQCDSNESRK